MVPTGEPLDSSVVLAIPFSAFTPLGGYVSTLSKKSRNLVFLTHDILSQPPT